VVAEGDLVAPVPGRRRVEMPAPQAGAQGAQRRGVRPLRFEDSGDGRRLHDQFRAQAGHLPPHRVGVETREARIQRERNQLVADRRPALEAQEHVQHHQRILAAADGHQHPVAVAQHAVAPDDLTHPAAQVALRERVVRLHAVSPRQAARIGDPAVPRSVNGRYVIFDRRSALRRLSTIWKQNGPGRRPRSIGTRGAARRGPAPAASSGSGPRR